MGIDFNTIQVILVSESVVALSTILRGFETSDENVEIDLENVVDTVQDIFMTQIHFSINDSSRILFVGDLVEESCLCFYGDLFVDFKVCSLIYVD